MALYLVRLTGHLFSHFAWLTIQLVPATVIDLQGADFEVGLDFEPARFAVN